MTQATDAAAAPKATPCRSRQAPFGATGQDAAGAARLMAQGRSMRKRTVLGGIAPGHGAQARRKTSVPLVPPKPKLFLTATSIFMSRAMFAQ